MSTTLSELTGSIPLLPSRLFLPDGQEVDTGTDPWEVQDISWGTVRLPFNDLTVLHADTLLKLRHTMGHFLETRSISHATNLLMRFRAFHGAVLAGGGSQSVTQVELSHLLNWKGQLDKDTIWQLGVVRILLEKAKSLGYGFCSAEALAWLDEAVISGNPKGVNVRTRDPNRGPFTAAEVEALNVALNDAYVNGEVDLSNYAAGQVLLAFGIRSRQLAALKEEDLIVVRVNGDEKRYVLKIPQAKQRGELTRDNFRSRPCDRRLGRLLERLIEDNASRRNDPGVPEGDWPMFISTEPRAYPPGFAYHRSAKAITGRIQSIIERRTTIKANSRRFRHTLAQNMADDGASKYEIAEALGHADTQQVDKYIEATPEMVPRLNQMAEDFAPIMQAFAGILVSRDDLEVRAAPKSKQLHDRALEEGRNIPLGHCGQYGFCDIAKPVGCYTCHSFRAWDDGPHEQILAKLLAERRRQIGKRLSSKIYTIKDRTIAAVMRVVQLCRQRAAARAAQKGSK